MKITHSYSRLNLLFTIKLQEEIKSSAKLKDFYQNNT